MAQESKLILIGTTTDPVELITVHPAGKKAMNAGDWWRGRQNANGTTEATVVAS
jgi:methionyl-tRNA formyltransferase